MKTSSIGSIVIVLTLLLTCSAQAVHCRQQSPRQRQSVFVISQPGSYCLANNIIGVAGKNGITINADNVTLDLDGFGMVGAGGSLSGILINNHLHIVIRNGSIRGWGSHGVDGTNGALARIEDLRAAANGGNGLIINSGSQVSNCVAGQNTGDGIAVSNDVLVTGCVSSFNGGNGFGLGTACTIKSCLTFGKKGAGITTGGVNYLTVIDCNAHTNSGGGIAARARAFITSSTAEGNGVVGISVGASSTVSNCHASGNTGDGIVASDGSAVTGCTVSANAGDGIEVDNRCRLDGNTCEGNGTGRVGGAGIHATARSNRIDGNTATRNDRGIDVDAGGNLVVRNDTSLNTTNYDIVAGNTNANVESPGTNFVLDRPWANFRR